MGIGSIASVLYEFRLLICDEDTEAQLLAFRDYSRAYVW